MNTTNLGDGTGPEAPDNSSSPEEPALPDSDDDSEEVDITEDWQFKYSYIVSIWALSIK